MEEQLNAAFQNMVTRLGDWLNTIITNLPNIVLATTVFLFAYWLSHKLRTWLEHPVKRFIKQASARALVVNVAAILVTTFGLFLALGILNLDTVLKSLLAGAGVAGIAIGLALQGTLSNTFSGVFLAVKDILNVGDFVETNGYSGKVYEINLRNTKIREADNNIVIIPNKMVLDSPFKNYGLTRKIRTSVQCGVGYESDLEEVKQVTINTLKKHFPPETGERIEFHYLEFGGSSINFQVRFWLNATAELTAVEARSRAIMLLKKAFDKHQINIPYPIRTVYHENFPKSPEIYKKAFALT